MHFKVIEDKKHFKMSKDFNLISFNFCTWLHNESEEEMYSFVSH